MKNRIDEMNRAPMLEVIACTVEDAMEAKRGGADRIEVVRELEHGGFTPPVELVREIQRAVDLPLRVMLREEYGYGLTGAIAVEKLCCLASEFDEMAVDGVVLGFLREGEVDIEMTTKVLAYAPRIRATFHHAFEDTFDKLATIEQLKTMPQIDRILAHGGKGDWADKAARLERYAQAAHPEMKILVGGGVNARVVAGLRLRTTVREFHTGRAARKDGTVRAELVAELVRTMRNTL